MKEKSLRRSLIRIAIAAVLLALSALVIWLRGRQAPPKLEVYQKEVIPPTCESGGYTLYTNPETGEVVMDNIVPATGHAFGEWASVSEPTLLEPGSRSRVCEKCAAEERGYCYAQMGLPVLALEGDLTGIGKKAEVPMEARLFTEEGELESYATLKYQGHSSLQFDKKNYTLKFWEDIERTEKRKLTFSHWNKENKYILKADYLDPTMCRNLLGANVWAQVVSRREDLPEQFRSLSNYGAVDGFPTVLYINGEFQGIYNMNLHKDDDLFGMKDGAPHAIMIANDPTAPEAFFKGEAQFTETSPWETEFCGTEDKTWAEEKLNELITFVMESDDATFRKELHNYLDVNSAIDYLLTVYALGLTNHGADELILVCYDKNQPWVASLYDMETAFGLSADGKTFLPADIFLPGADSATENLLWDRLLENFRPELCSRYAELRKTVFAPENLLQLARDAASSIPGEVYAANDALHEGLPAAEEGIAAIETYIQTRIPLLDKQFLLNEG